MERSTQVIISLNFGFFHSIKNQENYLVFSNVPLQGENIWNKIKPGEVVEVDSWMKINSQVINLPFKMDV